MLKLRLLAIVTLVAGLGGQSAYGQEPVRYRAYALESSLATVVRTSGARETDARTLHSRPAMIQSLEWRAPYGRAGSAAVDPVRTLVFEFYNDQLYRLVVSYDRDRTEGLTDDDVIGSISEIYGIPALPPTLNPQRTAPAHLPVDTTLVARWETSASSVFLVRRNFSLEFQLILLSSALSSRAATATAQALVLNASEAPQREIDERKLKIDSAAAARDKARIANKGAFRP